MPSRDRGDPIQASTGSCVQSHGARLAAATPSGEGPTRASRGMPAAMGLLPSSIALSLSQRPASPMALVTQHMGAKQAYLGPGVLIVYGQQGQAIPGSGCSGQSSVRVSVIKAPVLGDIQKGSVIPGDAKGGHWPPFKLRDCASQIT